MTPSSEPRALSAALSAPQPFVTRGGQRAARAADRHIERWAPEASANRSRPLRNLGFVDRLISPWLETAQRSAGLRMFSQYLGASVPERESSAVSWVFPRPWYQDELDWMASARDASQMGQMSEAGQAQASAAPRLLTTRGTYVAPRTSAMPSALFEYVAPSLSIAPAAGAGGAGVDAYSPLVPFAASQTARMMSHAVARLPESAAAPSSPGLRAVLATLLQRTAIAPPTMSRLAMTAPELVTPPAPQPVDRDAERVAEHYAERRAQLAELQRVTQAVATRELAAPPARAAAPVVSDAAIQQRATELAARREAAVVDAATAAERRRIDERIAQRVVERGATQRLHDHAREQAVRDAQHAVQQQLTEQAFARPSVAMPAQRGVPAEIAIALAALPPELASYVGRRPERAIEAVGELVEALRAVELMARTAGAGGAIEPARGPRLIMPSGLGGLVATVQRTQRAPRAVDPASTPGRRERAPRVPTFPLLAAPSRNGLGATVAAAPAALGHVAWADRWLARFAGAKPQALDTFAATASPTLRRQLLAEAAPETVFVAPAAQPGHADVADTRSMRDGARPRLAQAAPSAPSAPVVRYDDNAETPDDVFAAISAAAMRSRGPQTAAVPARTPDAPMADARDSYADAVARGVPAAPGAGLSAQLASSPFAPALRHVMPLAAASSFDVRALFGDGLGASYLAGWLAPETEPMQLSGAYDDDRAPTWEPTYVAPELGGDVESAIGSATESAGGALPATALAALAPLITLRSALLSWHAEPTAAGAPGMTASSAGGGVARSLVDAMTLPMLGETAVLGDAGAAAYAPGMIADRAHSWSVAQERSSADLAFDFVPPELVLAARVYGLGPAEAAQAARLAIAGPGQLGAMATTIDRTFVQVMAAQAEQRASGQLPGTDAAPGRERAGQPAPRSTTFGVERRTPRGAVLWPPAAVGSLGMHAAAPDGEQSMSVAALEMLAARSVAELGTYATLGEDVAALGDAAPIAQAIAARAAKAGGPTAATTSTSPVEPTERDVLDTALALVPTTRRAKFEALFIAVGQTATGRQQSHAARAARALALAGRGEDAITARERAAIAWDVMPSVYVAPDGAAAHDDAAVEAAVRGGSPGARALGGAGYDEIHVDGRPGLGALSARAGEALGSYVAAPASATGAPAPSSSPGGGSREVGAVMRAPTAAQELVRPGRPSGRHGGGEVEIPSWFESAARKMLEDRSGAADGISLAELTLIAAAPQTHVAASTRGGPAAVPSAPPPADGGDHASGDSSIDIEKIAHDVYKQILSIMDAARARNGDSFL